MAAIGAKARPVVLAIFGICERLCLALRTPARPELASLADISVMQREFEAQSRFLLLRYGSSLTNSLFHPHDALKFLSAYAKVVTPTLRSC